MSKDAGATGPDPELMAAWCSQLVDILVKACQVDTDDADAIAQDVLDRATAFSALPDRTRDVLITPFVEEVFDHEPRDASLDIVAATTVVVRNSRLEDAHALGPVEDGTLKLITKTAAGPLSHLLAAGRRGMVTLTGDDPFSDLATTYPRAWACSEALAGVATDDGGRAGYRPPDAPVPGGVGRRRRLDAN